MERIFAGWRWSRFAIHFLAASVFINSTLSLTGAQAQASQQAQPVNSQASQVQGQTAKTTVDEAGTIHLPAVRIPFSSLASKEAQKNFLDFVHGFATLFDPSGREATSTKRGNGSMTS